MNKSSHRIDNHPSSPSSPMRARLATFDTVNYEFSFESVFDHAECRVEFEKYLKATHNSEPLQFIEQVELFTSKKSAKNRYRQANEIIETFVAQSSPNEINIAGDDRQNVIDTFEKSSEDNCPKSLFEKLYLQMFKELKEDNFPKFIASEQFRMFFAEKMANEGEAYFGSIVSKKKTKIESDTSSSDLTDVETELNSNDRISLVDMSSPLITETHFQYLLKQFANDSSTEWKRVGKSKYDNRSLYTSKDTYTLDNSKRFIRKMKETGIVPYSAEELFHAIIDEECAFMIEATMTSAEQVAYHPIAENGSTYATTVFQMKLKPPFPIGKRDFVISQSARKEKNGSYLIVKKSSDWPKASGHTRAELFGGIMVTPLYRDSCRYESSFLIDLRGWLPLRLWNVVMTQRDDTLHEGILKACESRRVKFGSEVDKTPPTRSVGTYDTFRDNMANLKRRSSYQQQKAIRLSVRDMKPIQDTEPSVNDQQDISTQ